MFVMSSIKPFSRIWPSSADACSHFPSFLAREKTGPCSLLSTRENAQLLSFVSCSVLGSAPRVSNQRTPNWTASRRTGVLLSRSLSTASILDDRKALGSLRFTVVDFRRSTSGNTLDNFSSCFRWDACPSTWTCASCQLTSHRISSTRACRHESHIRATDALCSARNGMVQLLRLRDVPLPALQPSHLPRTSQPQLQVVLLPYADGQAQRSSRPALRSASPSQRARDLRASQLASSGYEPV